MAEHSDIPSRGVFWHTASVTRARRERQNGHRGAVLWFTGLPSSGKSTIAHALEERLHGMACRTFVMDGDNIRHGLCSDLGFSLEDREENVRRVAEVARLFVEAGIIVSTALISPSRLGRERARELYRLEDFLEIYSRCPVAVCEDRDVKGLYRRARLGQVKAFTGISAPYEEPRDPQLILDTAELRVEESVDQIYALLIERGIIAAQPR
jgi:adenylylsulfate kinase